MAQAKTIGNSSFAAIDLAIHRISHWHFIADNNLLGGNRIFIRMESKVIPRKSKIADGPSIF